MRCIITNGEVGKLEKSAIGKVGFSKGGKITKLSICYIDKLQFRKIATFNNPLHQRIFGRPRRIQPPPTSR